ncbi:MAG: hypothetical protein FJ106_01755 [Deltaproteobacteria bacterium]|nr:hypothetical protein [Deltaproteobacteria bacterium]
MIDQIIKWILIFLLVFTPIAFGSVELIAFSLMELTIILMIILGVIQTLRDSKLAIRRTSIGLHDGTERYPVQDTGSNQISPITVILLFLFLCLILFQTVPLPSGILKLISHKAFEIRNQLLMGSPPAEAGALSFQLSLFPFGTQIEFLKWFTLIGLFLFLVRSSLLCEYRRASQFIFAILLIGVGESLYGMYEFFSGNRSILYVKSEFLVSSVTGTFINRNYLAGYLLMVIPLSVGFLFSRETLQRSRYADWRQQLSSLDGKALLIGFSVIVMILGLFFTASRMGISSLLLSFSLITLLFRSPQKERRFSRTSALILGLALLWAAWIGLDAVISRFFTASEDFKSRWMIWKDTFRIFKDFPLFGSGLGTFAQIFPMYRSFHIRGLVTHAENDPLQLASEVGLVGMGMLIMIFVPVFLKAFSGIRSLSVRDSKRYIGIGGLVGVLALMFHSLVERNIQIPANAFLFTFIFAMVLRLGFDQERGRIGLKRDFVLPESSA